jgi:hypothetical protein
MKKSSWVVFAFVLASAGLAQADVQDGDSSPAGFWDGLKTLASECVVRPYTLQEGQKTYGHTESDCHGLKVNGPKAVFEIDGQLYVAYVQDSADSDGGDLNDLFVQDASGVVVIQEHNVLAFGDVLWALLGQKVQLNEVYVQSLN